MTAIDLSLSGLGLIRLGLMLYNTYNNDYYKRKLKKQIKKGFMEEGREMENTENTVS